MEPVEGRNYLACGFCHTCHFPTELEDSADRITPLAMPADADCPVCCRQLAVGALDETRMMYCEQCRGILIPNGAFADVAQNRRRCYTGPDETPVPIDPRQFERRLGCPRCNRPMEAHPYHGPGCVVIDSCAACHLVWLDHGELAAIERAPGVRQPAVAPYEPSIRPRASEPAEESVNLLDFFFG